MQSVLLQAEKALEGKLDAMEAALARLVNVNSFTDNAEGGRVVGKVLEELFDGMQTERVSSKRFADHLVFRTQKDTVRRNAVALVGHLDTVFPPGTFEGYRRDGALSRGPGVLDMKGGLVVMAFAARAACDVLGVDRLVPLRIVIVSDEEVGSPEGQAVIGASISDASACLVFEAGRAEDRIITRRKGTGGMTVVAHGKGAHAGNNPEEGANAIWALASFVDRVQSLSDPKRGVSVNVGVVRGGQGKNTVPDRAEAELDLRFCSVDDGEVLTREIARAAEDAAARVPGTRLELRGGIARKPLEQSAANLSLLEEYAVHARAVGLGAEPAPLLGGGSDASTASALGIAAIDGLGPRGKGFHTKDECIELATLVPKAQALARFLVGRSLGGQAHGFAALG